MLTTWDARNRLASMTGASFSYDALGRRMTKTISGVSTGFLYDGVNPVQELSGATPTANLLTGLGIDQFFNRADSSGTKTLLTDALGSTLALTDTAGAVQTEYIYEPFGKTTTTGTANSNSFQYTGRENDGTELYYYRARYYNPGIERFLNEDPLYSPLYNASKCRGSYSPSASWYIEVDRNLAPLLALRFYGVVSALGTNPQKLHAYTYAEDNPVNKVDPTGLWAAPQS